MTIAPAPSKPETEATYENQIAAALKEVAKELREIKAHLAALNQNILVTR